jgi:hypothetical protein
MEARLIHLSIALSIIFSMGAVVRTPNFVVTAPTEEIATQAGQTAERYRSLLAKAWLDKELPNWSKPCKLKVKIGQIGAGGATTFQFHKGHVYGWNMTVQGTLERVLDSVIPHEVSHTIFASYFRRPLPRWADEGAATLIEHESEKSKQRHILKQVFNTSRRIPLNTLLKMKEYPTNRQDVYTLYAEGYSLSNFLVQARGKKRFLLFLETAHHKGWTFSLNKHYNLSNINVLEKRWNDWIIAGSPDLYPDKNIQLADASGSQNNRSKRIKLSRKRNVTVRSQNPDKKTRHKSSQSKKRRSSETGSLTAPTPLNRLKRSAKDKYSYTLANQKRWELKNKSNRNSVRSNERIKLPIKRTISTDEKSFRSSSKIEKYNSGKLNSVKQSSELPLMQLDDTFNKETNAGVMNFSSNRDPEWTDFPRRRTGHGAT